MKKLLILLILALFLSGCTSVEHTSPDVLAKFKQFVDNDDLSYAADYIVSASGNSYSMKQYFLGENKIRTDLEIGGQSASTYILDKEVYTCALQAEWICVKMENQKMESVTELLRKVEQYPEEYVILYNGTENILGREAYCFTIKLPEMLGMKMRECFSLEGVPLLLSSGSLVSMEATSYSLDVDEDLFELPAKPVSMEEFASAQNRNLEKEIEQERQELLQES